MVTQNQTSATTIVLLATVLLLTFVPFSHSIPYVFADKQGLFTGFGHATTSTQGQTWNQDPQQQHNKDWYKNWHHHDSNGDGQTNYIKNNQLADCSSTSTANGGNANGGSGGTGSGGNGGTSLGGKGGDSNGGNGSANGGNGGASPGGNGGDSNGGNGATAGNGGPGGPSNGGPGGDEPGGPGGTGGSGSAGSQTACSNTSTFNISHAA